MSMMDMPGVSGSGDMAGQTNDGMMSVSTDMAHGSGGVGSCSAFLTCVANCPGPPGCVTTCRSKVRQTSIPILMSLINCACATCLQGGNPPCATWDDTSNASCGNCEYVEMMPSGNPQVGCMTQYQACVNDT
jgi:hypothetical protein